MKKKLVIAAIVIIAIIIAAAAALTVLPKAKAYAVSEDGVLSYGPRPAANFTITPYNETQYATIYKIAYWSRDRTMYGLLSLPKNATQPYTAFILLPANSIPKESEQSWLGNDLNMRGYAAFSIDQRGVGQASDAFVDTDADYGKFVSGGEPEEYKMYYDALAAFDVLSWRPRFSSEYTNSAPELSDELEAITKIDRSAIYMAGESMGGRIAIIAAAMEPRIAGVIGVSTGGYGVLSHQEYSMQLFIRSIDPDNYVASISPRKVLLLHSLYDQTISSLTSNRTYDHALEPKKLILDEGSDHGYYRHEKIYSLNEGLPWLTG